MIKSSIGNFAFMYSRFCDKKVYCLENQSLRKTGDDASCEKHPWSLTQCDIEQRLLCETFEHMQANLNESHSVTSKNVYDTQSVLSKNVCNVKRLNICMHT